MQISTFQGTVVADVGSGFVYKSSTLLEPIA